MEILWCLQANYGTPSTQEEEDATARFGLPMDQDDPPEVMMLHLEEIQVFLAHLNGDGAYTDI